MSAASRARERRLAIGDLATDGPSEPPPAPVERAPYQAQTFDAPEWTVCCVGWREERELVLVKPGVRLTGWRAFQTPSPFLAQVVMESISRPDGFGRRIPVAGSCIGIKRQAEEAAAAFASRKEALLAA